MVLARDVVGFETRGPVRAVRFDGAGEIEARTVLVATGVSYRLLEAPGLDELTGRGVYYGATPARRAVRRATTCTSSARPTRPARPRSTSPASPERVVLLVRSDVAREIDVAVPRRTHLRRRQHRRAAPAEVVAARGDGHLEALTLADRGTGAKEDVPTNWLFVFIGASPRTDWLGDDVVRDDKGFVITGPIC